MNKKIKKRLKQTKKDLKRLKKKVKRMEKKVKKAEGRFNKYDYIEMEDCVKHGHKPINLGNGRM